MLGSQLVSKTHQIQSPGSHFFQKYPGGHAPRPPHLQEHALHTVYFTCGNLLSPKKIPPSSKKSCMKPWASVGAAQSANLVSILDEEPVGCLSEARGVVEVAQIAPDVGIVHNALLIAL